MIPRHLTIRDRWDIFDPNTGRTVLSTPFRCVAWFFCVISGRDGLDYERKGEGYVDNYARPIPPMIPTGWGDVAWCSDCDNESQDCNCV